MKPAALHSYLLWRSSLEPTPGALARDRYTASVSLLPALMVGLFVFGWWAGLVMFVSLFTAFATDILCKRIFRNSLNHHPHGPEDGVWLLTGLLIGFLLPPQVALWVPALGSFIAIFLGKHWLSIDGATIVQPAALALLLLHLFLWPVMHPKDKAGQPQWPVLTRSVVVLSETGENNDARGIIKRGVQDFFEGDIRLSIDRQRYKNELFKGQQPLMDKPLPGENEPRVAQAMYGPRPLDFAKHPAKEGAIQKFDWLSVFLGYTPGPIGGTSGLALLLGILLLVFTGTVSWLTPVFAMAVLAGGALIFDSQHIGIHLLSGYTLLGFFYLAADPANVARSKRGKILAGLIVGLTEVLLRYLTPLSEATFISAVAVQPLCIFIDQHIAPPKEPPANQVNPVTGWSSLGRL